jgi:hypothetical protein
MSSRSLNRWVISKIYGGDTGGDEEIIAKNKEVKVNVTY